MKIFVKQFLDSFIVSLDTYLEIYDVNTHQYVFKGECGEAYEKLNGEYKGPRYFVSSVEPVASDDGDRIGLCLDISLRK